MTSTQTRPRSPFSGKALQHFDHEMVRMAQTLRTGSGLNDFDVVHGSILIAPVALGPQHVELAVFPEAARSLPDDSETPRADLEKNLSARGLTFVKGDDRDPLRVTLTRTQLESALQGMSSESSAFECLIHTAARLTMNVREIHAAVMKGSKGARVISQP